MAHSDPAEPGFEALSGDTLKAAARKIGRSIEAAAESSAIQLKQQADERLHNSTKQLGEHLSVVAAAIERVASESDLVDPANADFAASAARQLNRFAETMERQNVDSLTAQTTKVARRNPLLTIGLAAVVGVAIGRFVQSASDVEPES